ncbi:MAG: zinc-dependent metalloprotease family protein [Bacteroidota bacterium]
MPTFSLLRRGLAGLAVLALTASAASAQPSLFTPLDGARVALDARQSQFLTAFETERGVEAVDLVQAEASRLRSASALRIALPDAEVVLQTVRVVTHPSGHISWTGRAEGDAAAASWAVLVMRDGQITGEVHADGEFYPVRPLTGGLHAVAKKSLAAYRTHPEGYEAFVAAHRDEIAAERAAEATALAHQHRHGDGHRHGNGHRHASSTTTVDVIVPYTTNITAVYADPFALAQSFVDITNVAYDNSGLADLELRLVNAYETPHATTGNLQTDLENIRGTTDGISDEVHTRRTAYGADLVALISGTNTSGFCGIAYVNASSSTAFSANSAGCGALTFAHEVGHNFGAAHDPITGGVVAYSYGQGYADQAGDWGTVMAYDAACDDDGTPGAPPFSAFCQIIPYFSNPDVSYTDTTSPVNSGPTGTATTSDNARVHEERASTVAAFRAAGTPPVLTYGPATLAEFLAAGGTDTQTLTIENTAGATSTPLNWSASLGNATGPTSSRVAQGRLGVSVAPLDARPPAAPRARLAGGAASDCVDGDQIAQTSATAIEAVASGGTELGQTFTASCTGRLEKVVFGVAYGSAPSTTWGVTLRIYEGVGTGGTELLAASASVTNGPSGNVALTFTLPTPVDLTDGQSYSFFLDLTSNNTGLLVNNGNPYAGGAKLRTTNGSPAGASTVSGEDLYFRLDLLAPTTPSISWVSLSANGGSLDSGQSDNVTVSFDATGLADGVYTADLTLVTTDPEASTTTIPVQLTVGVEPAFAIGDGFGWRMLALPYDGVTVETLADQNLVQGTPDSYPGAGTNLFTSYDGTDWISAGAHTEAVAPGSGVLWYLYDQAVDPDLSDPTNSVGVELPMMLTGSGAEPSADVSVALHAGGDGWNLLGNPFLLDLDVSGVTGWTGAGNLQSLVGQVWQCAPNTASPVECVGSYTTTTLLGDVVPAWSGVFFDAASAGALTIPVAARGATSRRTAPRLLSFELATADGSALDRAATVVFRDGAEAGWDGWDAEKLASLASPSVQIALGGERDGEALLKAQDSRPLDPATFEVPVHVASAGAGPNLVLTWPRLDGLPSAWSLTLTDHETNETVDLRTADRHAFTVTETAARTAALPGASARLGGDTPRFTLTVRTSNAVSTEVDTPAETWLGTPYPNPTRGAATVPFGLAEAGAARLTLVDLLGREVAVLSEGELPAGDAQAALPTAGLAPGLYVVRLEAGGRVLTRRAVVVR